jgi:hypothetical protein
MRLPKVRVTVRGLMVVVAIVALITLGGREFWAWWLRRGYRNPVFPSTLSARAGINTNHVLVPGRPIPVSITYNFTFSNPKPPQGATCVVWASVWFEDRETRRYVEGYTFDAPLTVGGRESATGTFTWDAMIPRPGHYLLHYRLYHGLPGGDLKHGNGGGTSYSFVEAAPVSQPPGEPGASP